jgi:hypothetical protein
MRRMTGVLLVVFFLATVLGTAAPALAKDGRREHKRDRFIGRGYWYGQFAGYRRGYSAGYPRGGFDGRWRDPYIGYQRDYFDGYRRSRFIVIPRNVVAIYPEYVTVVRPVVYDDVVLLPRYQYRVLERYPDHFLLIFGTGNLTVILRG